MTSIRGGHERLAGHERGPQDEGREHPEIRSGALRNPGNRRRMSHEGDESQEEGILGKAVLKPVVGRRRMSHELEPVEDEPATPFNVKLRKTLLTGACEDDAWKNLMGDIKPVVSIQIDQPDEDPMDLNHRKVKI